MALPVTGTVTAKWQDWRGRAGGEPIKLIPTAPLVYHAPTDYAYHNTAILLSPDSEGFATATVLSTNSPDLTPAGWGYEVVFPRSWNVPSKVISVPTGSTVDLFAAAGIVPETDVQVGVVLSVNGVEPDVNGNVVVEVEDGDFVTQSELDTQLAVKVSTTALEAALLDVDADLEGLTIQVSSVSATATSAAATATAAGDLAEQTAADLQQLITEVPDRPKIRQQYITDGSGASIPSGSWAPIAGFLMVVPAAVGDYVEVNVTAMRSQTPDLFTDVAVLGASSIVRYMATGTGTPAPEGDPGFYIVGSLPTANGPRGFLVTPGDLVDGNVQFVMAASSTGSGKIFADATYPFYWRAVNFGPTD